VHVLLRKFAFRFKIEDLVFRLVENIMGDRRKDLPF